MLKILVILAILLVIAGVLKEAKKSGKSKRPLAPLGELKDVQSKHLLTPFEKKMFIALTSALPHNVVLAQVSMQALLTTTSQQTRNRFDRKIVDFVICSKQLDTLTVIELDDPSHRTKLAKDNERDQLLKNAGIPTIRYTSLPEAERIRHDIATLTPARATAGAGAA